ncbi:unnamed protein product [Porites evermanni]|uniref:Uncharacterized protein n=1 Tax=Porites evermanni TaxID=104178 RepID=A0ABN8Q1Z4_9CNID|nr:unnamed protein product [Porites evermanni]
MGSGIGTILASIGIPLAVDLIKKMTAEVHQDLEEVLCKENKMAMEPLDWKQESDAAASKQPIQNINTTTCGYFCFYFLNKMSKEVTTLYVNEYGALECCNCEPLSESDYESESDSSQDDPTYLPDSD